MIIYSLAVTQQELEDTNMSCPSCNCNPCQCNCSCDPANEAVSSALSNLQSNFLGTVTKQCVNGEVVWVLPCDLNEEFVGYPRLEGEALLCYWHRVIAELVAKTSQ